MKRYRIPILSLICLILFCCLAQPGRAAGSCKAGDIVRFGSYPQTKVTDSSLISSLNGVSKSWKKYPYFTKNTGSDADSYPTMQNNDLMDYADITYGGVKYRAVRLHAYRPSQATALPGSNSYQEYNGYQLNTVYYFIWEPIEWVVLDPASGLVLSLKTLDSQEFCNYYLDNKSSQGGDQHSVVNVDYRVNNYVVSTVRAWLNAKTEYFERYGSFNFLNSAFSTAEKAVIQNTKITNPDSPSDYRMDPVFLLSKEEFEDYGDSLLADPVVIPTESPTDYACAQGKPSGMKAYYLRTPVEDNDEGGGMRSSGLQVYYASTLHAVYTDIYARHAASTMTGIRPALHVDLTSSLVVATKEPDFSLTGTNGLYPKVSWAGSGLSNISSFDIYRCPNYLDLNVESNWTKIKSVSGSTTSHTDKTADPETYYTFKVVATDSTGQKFYSELAEAHGRLPNAEITMYGYRDSGKPIISWADTGAAQYKIYSKEQSGSWTLRTTTSTSRSFVDTTAVAEETRRYQIVSVSGESPDFDSVLSSSGGTDVPCKLSSTGINTTAEIYGVPSVSWFPVTGAGGYQLEYKKASDSSWTVAASVPAGTTSTSHLAAPSGTCLYRVTVLSSKGSEYDSLPSDSVEVTWSDFHFTKIPANVSADVGKTAKFTVAATGSGLTYQWQYRSPGGSWTNSGFSSANKATLSFTAQNKYNAWQYRCRVTNSAGKTITSPYGTLTVQPNAVVKGCSLELEGRLGIRLRVTVPDAAVKATLKFQGESTKTVNLDLIRDAAHGYNSSTKEFTLVYDMIAAKEMTCPLTLKILDASGKEFAVSQTTAVGTANGTAYTVKVYDWAEYAMYHSTAVKTIRLARALLNYGGAAQKYFKFRLDDPANPEGFLTAETAAVTKDPAMDGTIPSDAETKLGYKSMALNLEGDTELQLKFSKKVTAVMDGKSLSVKASGSDYYVSIPGIAAKDLSVLHTVKVSYGSSSCTFKVAALTYANKVLDASSNQDLITCMKALYLYNQAAKNYFGN